MDVARDANGACRVCRSGSFEMHYQWCAHYVDDNVNNYAEKQTPLETFKDYAQEVASVDMVNHPPHYKNHPSGIECIQITRHMNFNLGNAMKYIWRCEDKGDPIENLKKALFYLEDEIKRREGTTLEMK